VDVSKSLPRFIELVLSPQERGEADSHEVQRMALESLREARPGMLIDHIVETGSAGSGPVKHRPLFMRLRSHAEARTFDELRVFELGRLVRKGEPDWHETVVELVYQARGILVDTSGLVADPANEGGGRSERQRAHEAQQAARSRTRSASPKATGSSGGAPPPVRPSTTPSWGPTPESPPSIDMPSTPAPRELGTPAPSHVVTSTRRDVRPQTTSAPPSPRRQTPNRRFFALCEGQLLCPDCAQPMTIQSMGHDRRMYYTCPAKHLHPSSQTQPEVFFPVDVVDEAVWAHVCASLEDPKLALEIVREAADRGVAGGESRRAQARSRLERLERDELEVLKLRSEDRISEGAARHRLGEIREERRALEEELRSDSGADSKLRPLQRAIEGLVRFAEASGQPLTEANYGQRRSLLEADVPSSAEYGVFPHADGTLEIRDQLNELDLSPKLRHRARSIGRFAGDLKDRVAAAGPRPKAGLEGLLERARALIPRKSAEAAESKDLGRALQASARDHQPTVLVGRPPPRQSWLLYGFLLVASVMIAILFQPNTGESVSYEDQSSQLGVAEELEQLHEVPGGWIGVLSPTWEGAGDKDAAMAVCERLAGQLELARAETITLMVPGGLPLAECRSSARPAASEPAQTPESAG